MNADYLAGEKWLFTKLSEDGFCVSAKAICLLSEAGCIRYIESSFQEQQKALCAVLFPGTLGGTLVL